APLSSAEHATRALHDALPISEIDIVGAVSAEPFIVAQRAAQRLQTGRNLWQAVFTPDHDLFQLASHHPRAALGDIFVVHGERPRSEEHTSELQSRENRVCRLR